MRMASSKAFFSSVVIGLQPFFLLIALTLASLPVCLFLVGVAILIVIMVSILIDFSPFVQFVVL